MAWSKIATLVIVGSVLGGMLAFLSFFQESSSKNQDVFLNNKEINLLIAKTPAEHYQGLSNKVSLCRQCGMLFVFEVAEPRTFVMRRMSFPLDIVWIYKQTVVGISKNLPPESSEPYTLYQSPGEVDWVLELNAGAADFYNLEVGKKISISTSQ